MKGFEHNSMKNSDGPSRKSNIELTFQFEYRISNLLPFSGHHSF